MSAAEKNHLSHKAKFITLVGLAWTVVWLAGYLLFIYYDRTAGFDFTVEKGERADLGALGDFFGGFLNPLISGLGFVGVLYTIRTQMFLADRQEKQQVEEFTRQQALLELQQKQLGAQQAQMAQQTFEATFFRLLAVKNEILNALHDENQTNRLSGKWALRHFNQCFETVWRGMGTGRTQDLVAYALDSAREAAALNPATFFASFTNIMVYIDKAPKNVDRAFYSEVFRSQSTVEELSTAMFYGAIYAQDSHERRLLAKFDVFSHLTMTTDVEREIAQYYEGNEEAFGGQLPKLN